MKVKIINDSDLYSNKRFDSSYYLSDSVVFEKVIRENKYIELRNLVDDIFTAGRNKRVYVSNKKLGFPYLSNSDIVSHNSISKSKYVSKKYCSDLKSFLKERMIVTGRVGAIGQTAYITKELENNFAMGSDNIIRIAPKSDTLSGYLYAFLVSKYGNTFFWKIASGGVQPYISELALYDFPIPIIKNSIMLEIHNLIVKASDLRVAANLLLEDANCDIKRETGLVDLTTDDYEYYGNHSQGRKISTFKKNIKEIHSLSINSFNYSKRVEAIEVRIKKYNEIILLCDVLDEKKFFSTGSFPRVEIDSPKSIRLINQSDIFNMRIKGKRISRRKVKTENLVSYGEVLIAGVGTLGENESFCRVIFANEELEGELVSGEFIRMKTSKNIPSGYLYAWLSTDYGFRLIRKTQSGTKLCRPIPALLSQIPVPLLKKEEMDIIDKKVKKAHTYRFEALQKENQAIELVEKEIDSWQN